MELGEAILKDIKRMFGGGTTVNRHEQAQAKLNDRIDRMEKIQRRERWVKKK